MSRQLIKMLNLESDVHKNSLTFAGSWIGRGSLRRVKNAQEAKRNDLD